MFAWLSCPPSIKLPPIAASLFAIIIAAICMETLLLLLFGLPFCAKDFF
jgi:hypothetical protein